MLGMMIFIGWTIAAVIVPRLADLYGRKPLYLQNLVLQTVACLLLVVSKTPQITGLGLFLIGICCAGRWTVTYIYLTEFWTEKNIKRFGPFVNASAAVALVVGAFTFQVLTRKTVYIEYLALLLSVFAAIMGYFLMPESPKWLIGQGQMEKARLAYQTIVKTNGKEEDLSRLSEWTFKQETV